MEIQTIGHILIYGLPLFCICWYATILYSIWNRITTLQANWMIQTSAARWWKCAIRASLIIIQQLKSQGELSIVSLKCHLVTNFTWWMVVLTQRCSIQSGSVDRREKKKRIGIILRPEAMRKWHRLGKLAFSDLALGAYLSKFLRQYT